MYAVIQCEAFLFSNRSFKKGNVDCEFCLLSASSSLPVTSQKADRGLIVVELQLSGTTGSNQVDERPNYENPFVPFTV